VQGCSIFVVIKLLANGLPYCFIGFLQKDEDPFIDNMLCTLKISLRNSAVEAEIFPRLRFCIGAANRLPVCFFKCSAVEMRLFYTLCLNSHMAILKKPNKWQ